MGTRIHKVLGWALTDVDCDEDTGRITDARINADSVLLDARGHAPLADFEEFCRARGSDGDVERALINASRPDLQPDEPHHAVSHSSEGGDPRVLLIRPVWAHQWSRYDDALDWVTETIRDPEGTCAPRVERLNSAPFPYSGVYMDVATGQRLTDPLTTWHRTYVRIRHAGRATAAEMSTIERTFGEHAKEVMPGVQTWAQALERIAPLVPESVTLLAEWGRLFTDPSVCFQLRPVLYTYWG